MNSLCHVRRSAAAILIVFIALIGLAAPSDASVLSQPRQVRVGIGLGESHPQGLAVKKFADLVHERTRGRVLVTLYADGRLGNDVTMIRDLQAGKLEMAVPDTATLVSLVKGFGILNFPFLFSSEEEADALLDGSFGDKLLASLEAHGLVGLGFWENGFRNITNNVKPITKAADLRGLRMRVMQNPMFIDTFKAFGASATPMPFPELFGALQANKIDGQENPLATIQSAKFYSVQRYLTLSRHSYSVWALLISKKTWDQLTQDERTAIKASAIEARDFERRTIRANNERILQELHQSGMVINDISSVERSRFRMITRPIIEQYKHEFGKEWSADLYFGLMANELNRFSNRAR